jgi:hypothetical protein
MRDKVRRENTGGFRPRSKSKDGVKEDADAMSTMFEIPDSPPRSPQLSPRDDEYAAMLAPGRNGCAPDAASMCQYKVIGEGLSHEGRDGGPPEESSDSSFAERLTSSIQCLAHI